jgi:hypothetical protein
MRAQYHGFGKTMPESFQYISLTKTRAQYHGFGKTVTVHFTMETHYVS